MIETLKSMIVLIILNVFSRFWVIVFLIFTGCYMHTKPSLVIPNNGEVINTNTPVLAWKTIDADWQEIWINGILMDSLGPGVNSYVPFPLAYGNNYWHIKSKRNGKTLISKQGSFIVDDQALVDLPQRAHLLRHNWYVQSSYLANDGGEVLSTLGLPSQDWHSTSIPSTVLSALVRNGVYPNPYIGKNNMLIPDAHDDYNKEYDLMKYSHIPGQNPWDKPWWFINEFSAINFPKGKRVWINFGEINYRAQLWFNGAMLADTSDMVGMEREFRFEITNILQPDAINRIAIAIYPLDNPGEPAVEPLEPFGDPGTNMGDGLISLDYTKWDAVGWDWQPAIRDRDMGITEDVYLSFTDDVEIQDVYITSDLLFSDDISADFTISFDLVNHSYEQKQGLFTGLIVFENDSISFEQPFSLQGHEIQPLTLDKNAFPQFHLSEPRLWWPAGYGNPDLYTVKLTAQTSDEDHAEVEKKHGIRKIETYIGKRSRVFRINNQDIFLKGGNWVMEMMLNATASRYENEILLSRNAGFNILRVWGPTGVPPEVMYHAADKYGIVMWQDFLNDYWGTFRNTPGYSPDEKLYETISTGIVKRYRNHASLMIWCGGNEGVNPREDMLVNEILATYDGRSGRIYLKESDGDGLHGGGPYHTLRPDEYFGHPRMYGFSSEIGPSGVPVIESIRRFMPDAGQQWKPDFFPVDGTWAYHDAANFPGSDLRKFTAYDDIVRIDYGGPETEDQQGVYNYFSKCQMINYDVYRAATTAIVGQMWDGSSGMLLWKSNSSWPSMVWQLYDWYLQTHAGYYAVKKAFAHESIHLNRDNRSISVVNYGSHDITDAGISAVVYDESMNVIWQWGYSTSIEKNSANNLDVKIPNYNQLHFLVLSLKDSENNVLADNFYWLHAKNDFTELASLGEPDLSAVVTKNNTGYKVILTNKGQMPSLLTRIKLMEKESLQEILPTIWSDNFVFILPGETKELAVKFTSPITLPVKLSVKAFNMKEEIMFAP